jgi:D-arabinose 1-dehydrogenase-like Zn-dependent alcohol dehydrogenase
MRSTYKAVEVSAPGVLRLVERPVSEPGVGQVRLRVEACGICHTDAATVSGTYPGLTLPRVPGHEVVGRIVSGLATRGKLIVVGVPLDEMKLSAFPLVFGGRSIYGSLAGLAIDTEDALAFSVLEDIRPMIETFPLERADDAYARMMQGKARFRMVLVTKKGVAQGAQNAA